MHVSIHFELSEEQQNYFSSCARIRGISHKALVRRLIDVACTDQMIGSILDDGARRQRRLIGESVLSHFRKSNKKPQGPDPGA